MQHSFLDIAGDPELLARYREHIAHARCVAPDTCPVEWAEEGITLPGGIEYASVADVFFALPAGEDRDYLTGLWLDRMTQGIMACLKDAEVNGVAASKSSVEFTLQVKAAITDSVEHYFSQQFQRCGDDKPLSNRVNRIAALRLDGLAELLDAHEGDIARHYQETGRFIRTITDAPPKGEGNRFSPPSGGWRSPN